jgi:6-pyruvoyltetrahydropterin/6-carboxytetrahydropterin synthase
MTYQSTKRYGHEIGLSCAFRQWKAHSHCSLIHGYALAVKFTFEASELDRCGWVVDFGALKSLKGLLEDQFDHTLLVSEDDPHKGEICALAGLGIANVQVVEATGCEAFARLIFECTQVWLLDNGFAPRCWVASVEVSEHGANSAIYKL